MSDVTPGQISDAADARPGASRSAGGRLPFWDNARFICIVLVVLGHATQRLTYDSDVALALYLLIYAFHMPAFAIIAGYFSPSTEPTRRQMTRVITDLVLPYIIFESLWSLTQWLVEGRAEADFSRPSWTLWFLLALAIFRVALPYLALVRWPLLWSVVISIVAGYLPHIDSTFSLSRTLGLLPFFTLGWWLAHHDVVARLRLLRPRSPWSVVAACALFSAAGWAAWFFLDVWQAIELRRWLFYDDAYVDIAGAQWWAGGVRLALMIVALLLCAALFVLTPRRDSWWTHFGRYTMYVYLLHSFVLYPLRESGVLRGLEPAWLWLPIVVVGSVLLAMALSTQPVRRVFRPLVQPRLPWLFRDAAPTAPNSPHTVARTQRPKPSA